MRTSRIIAVLAVLVMATGCMHPFVNSKERWAVQQAAMNGFVQVGRAGVDDLYMPLSDAKALLGDKATLLGTPDGMAAMRVRLAETGARTYTANDLAKQFDPSGLAWREFGDNTLNVSAYSTAIGGLAYGLSELGNRRGGDTYNMNFAAGDNQSGTQGDNNQTAQDHKREEAKK